jgi:hypothetical protein
MIKYDPNNPLTDDELAGLSDDVLFDYLDQVTLSKKSNSKIRNAIKKTGHEILKRNGVKNVKTNRGQWFD